MGGNGVGPGNPGAEVPAKPAGEPKDEKKEKFEPKCVADLYRGWPLQAVLDEYNRLVVAAEESPWRQDGVNPPFGDWLESALMPELPEPKALEEEKDGEIWKKWREEGAKARFDDGSFAKFAHHVLFDYAHDYGTICHAAIALLGSALHAVDASPTGGLTGFQASTICLRFLRNEIYGSSRLGVMVRNLDDVLYPQYEDKFTGLDCKPEYAKRISALAAENLKETNGGKRPVKDEVKAWWERLAKGDFPAWIRVKAQEVK